jgi:hypothetical protein
VHCSRTIEFFNNNLAIALAVIFSVVVSFGSIGIYGNVMPGALIALFGSFLIVKAVIRVKPKN